MDGVVILFLLAYFFPSAIAVLRSHRNSTSIFLLNFLLGWTVLGWVGSLIWAAANGPRDAAATAPATPPAPTIAPATESALRVIRTTLEACQLNHADAIHVMAVVAQADGKISRNDLKIMFEFCARHGTVLPGEIYDAIPHLNAGVTMNIQGDATCPTAFAELERRPMLYLTGLHGVLTAMTIGARRKNKTATELMSRLEDLIQRRTGQPDPEPDTAPGLSINITDNLPQAGAEPAPPAAPEPTPKPAPFKPESWVEQARREIAAERQR